MQQRENCSLELPYATNGSVVCRIRHEWIYQLFDPFSRWLRSERTVRHGKRQRAGGGAIQRSNQAASS